jgi:hypothetical protein
MIAVPYRSRNIDILFLNDVRECSLIIFLATIREETTKNSWRVCLCVCEREREIIIIQIIKIRIIKIKTKLIIIVIIKKNK